MDVALDISKLTNLIKIDRNQIVHIPFCALNLMFIETSINTKEGGRSQITFITLDSFSLKNIIFRLFFKCSLF